MLTATEAQEILDLIDEGAFLEAGRVCEGHGCTFADVENFQFAPCPADEG